ncbi:MAG: long-chain fatty acid--CoA ligase [Verrucomicrobia bacterium]|nr:long-chain fatty acid--CoA ligase [Verrucomicrobiota bacterium]
MTTAAATLVSRFEEAAARHPRRKAIFFGRDKIRYRDVRARAAGFARILAEEHGVRPGDRVGLLLKNGPEFIYALYGILMAGGTVLPINNFLKAQEIEYILHDAGVKTLVTAGPDFEPVLQHLRDRLEALRPLDISALRWDEVAARPMAALPAVTASDRAVVIYTSGTTGRPKGAVLTHHNLVANIASCVEALGSLTRDRVVLVLPMFHSFMLTVAIFLPLSIGASTLIIKSIKPFRNVLFEMIFKRATVFLGIPQIFQALATARIPWWLRWLLPLRLAVSGSAPLPVETLKVFAQRFHFPLLEGYGLSEAAPVVCFNPLRGVCKPGSVGPPVPGVQVRIVDDNNRELGPEQVGEIAVQGDNVMLGYWNQDEATRATLRDGWLLTGDIGRKDADGYVYITDRKKDMLLVHGNNVYPREIEEVIYQMPGVREVAVVGKPDAYRGELPVAFVVPAEGVTLDPPAVLKFCRERLADYKLPREIRVVTEGLPRNATGKILKTELRNRLRGESQPA